MDALVNTLMFGHVNFFNEKASDESPEYGEDGATEKEEGSDVGGEVAIGEVGDGLVASLSPDAINAACGSLGGAWYCFSCHFF